MACWSARAVERVSHERQLRDKGQRVGFDLRQVLIAARSKWKSLFRAGQCLFQKIIVALRGHELADARAEASRPVAEARVRLQRDAVLLEETVEGAVGF